MADTYDFDDLSDVPEKLRPKSHGGDRPGRSWIEDALSAAGRPLTSQQLRIVRFRLNGRTIEAGSISRALHDLTRGGFIIRIRHGLYGLPGSDDKGAT